MHSRELHIFTVYNLVSYVVIHVTCHVFGTIPRILKISKVNWNMILSCAKPDYVPWVPILQIPPCPLEKNVDAAGILQSTIFVTGIILCIILVSFGITSQTPTRRKAFSMFHISHMTLMILWCIFIFLHGSNQWIGIGYPLSVPIVFPCLLIYLIPRILREFATPSEIVKAFMVGPRLIQVVIKAPPSFFKRIDPGMFANLKVYSISFWEWHPFSISEYSEKFGTVTFIISVCGDWTKAFADRCMQVAQPKSQQPPPLTPAGNKKFEIRRRSLTHFLGIEPMNAFPQIK